MSVQPLAHDRTGAWQPDPVRQRRADYTVADVLALPPNTPRVELVNGVIRVVPSPTIDHQDISGLLWWWLRTHAPREYEAVTAVGVKVSDRHTFEPDILLYRADADTGRHFLDPEEVVLVVEVVSPRTAPRDRITKPAQYAQAGIPHFWRIEQHPIHIYAYQLTADHTYPADRTYTLVADSPTLLTLTEPFPIKLPISEITPRAPRQTLGN